MAWKFKWSNTDIQNDSSKLVLIPVSLGELQELIATAVQAVMVEFLGKDKEGEKIMDSAEVCKEFGMSIPTLIKYRKEGLIPFFNIGNRVRFKRKLVHEALAKIRKVWRQG